MNDQNFVLSVLTLEELGATGNKGLSGVMTNPVLQDGLAGLATSATAQATVEVSICLLLAWDHSWYTVTTYPEGNIACVAISAVSCCNSCCISHTVICWHHISVIIRDGVGAGLLRCTHGSW